MKKSSNSSRLHRKKRINKKIQGTEKRPRLCVFRSNKAIYAQLVDDVAGNTLVGVDSRDLKKKAASVEGASEVGKRIAQKSKDLKVEEVVFDRGGYRYHGKVKALADAARKEGLKF